MNKMKKAMNDVTYFNEDYDKWGFYGCECDVYDSQEEAYEAYLATLE